MSLSQQPSRRHRRTATLAALAAAAVFSAALSLFPLAGAARADDWAQFRGPDRENRSAETGLLKQWPESGPPLVWKAKGLGEGYATVAVVNGRIYTMGDKDGASHLLAFSEKSGQPLWSLKVGKAGGGEDTTAERQGARCTPVVDGQQVYALGPFGELVCANALNGKEIWRADLVKDFGGVLQRWGFAETPLVDGPKLICTPGGPQGTLLALDKNTGKKIWQSKEWTDEAQYASPIARDIGGLRQYIQFTQKSVAGVSAEDGRVLWKAPFPGRVAVAAAPVYHDNHVLVSAGYGVGATCYKITAAGGGKFTAEKAWDSKGLKSHHGGFVRVGDFVYGSNDPRSLVCLQFKTGDQRWSSDEAGKGSLTFADGHLIYRPEQGATVFLVEATPDGFREKGRFEQPDRTGRPAWAYPVVADGRLYLRDQDTLLCYDVKAK